MSKEEKTFESWWRDNSGWMARLNEDDRYYNAKQVAKEAWAARKPDEKTQTYNEEKP